MKCNRVLLEKLTVPQLVMETSPPPPPAYYETQRFTTTSTMAAIFPILKQINPVHALPITLWFIILFSHLYLGLVSSLFLTGFSTKTLHVVLYSFLNTSLIYCFKCTDIFHVFLSTVHTTPVVYGKITHYVIFISAVFTDVCCL